MVERLLYSLGLLLVNTYIRVYLILGSRLWQGYINNNEFGL